MEGERVQAPHLAGVQAGWAAQDQLARPAAHLRLAPGDEGRAAQGGAGADGARDDRDDDALRAPVARRPQKRGPAAGPWQHCGNAAWSVAQLGTGTGEKWWRRRESNPRPKALPFAAATCLSRDLSSSGGSNTGTLPAGPSSKHFSGGSRGRVPGQPTFLTGLSGAMGWAPEVPRT